MLLDAAAQNHFSLFRTFYYLKKDYLNYNKAIATAAIHGNFDMVSHVFKYSRASPVYYHLALYSKSLNLETYLNLISSLSKTQQKNLFFDSARIGDSKLLEAFSASNIEHLDYTAWIDMAADFNHFDVVIENFSPSEISKVLIWNPKKTHRLSMLRNFLLKTKENESQERFRSNIFKEAAQRGDLGVTKIFFENPKNLNLKKKNQGNLDSKFFLILNGILFASHHSHFKTVKFLMVKIDIAAENNLLLNAAVANEDKNLVYNLLKDDRILNAGLDEAMKLTKSPTIFTLLYQKSILARE